MQRSEFCEKFYEIMIDHVLLDAGYTLYVPSQREEGVLGFDSYIRNFRNMTKNGPRIKGFALQFKTVGEYTRPPYQKENYKFDLHAANGYRQHNTLCRHNNGGKLLAAYCVPAYVTYHDLSCNFCSPDPLSDSFVIFPRTPILDKNYHYITFGPSSAHQHSEEPVGCAIDRLDRLYRDIDNTMSADEFVRFASAFRPDAENVEKTRRRFETSPVLAYKLHY